MAQPAKASLAMPCEGRRAQSGAVPLIRRRSYTPSPTGRGAAWLARLSGGQEVPSSNLGAPTQESTTAVANTWPNGVFAMTLSKGFPDLPAFLVGLTSVSALAYVTKKGVESTTPVISAVVPSTAFPKERVQVRGLALDGVVKEEDFVQQDVLVASSPGGGHDF